MGDGDKITINEDGVPLVERRKPTRTEKAKYYASLLLGLIATVDAFLFIFLVPFVIDPSISFFLNKFNATPGTCVTSSVERLYGQENITWSSCREGCTVTQYECTQMLVNYTREPPANNTIVNLNTTDELYDWEQYDVRLLINNKACGYPPHVQCWKFDQDYGKVGLSFPCYYSTVDPSIVVTRYEYDESMFGLLTCTIIPTAFFLVSTIVLSCWYCSCGKSTPLDDDDEFYDDVRCLEPTPAYEDKEEQNDFPDMDPPPYSPPHDKTLGGEFETHNGEMKGERRHSIECEKRHKPMLSPIEKHRRAISTV